MLRFLSTSRLSDHGQEDSFANEVANARVSDYSGSSGADPFRSGTQSPPYQKELGFSSLSREMSRDNLTEDVQLQSSVNTFSSPNAKGESDQVDTTLSLLLLKTIYFVDSDFYFILCYFRNLVLQAPHLQLQLNLESLMVWTYLVHHMHLNPNPPQHLLNLKSLVV